MNVGGVNFMNSRVPGNNEVVMSLVRDLQGVGSRTVREVIENFNAAERELDIKADKKKLELLHQKIEELGGLSGGRISARVVNLLNDISKTVAPNFDGDAFDGAVARLESRMNEELELLKLNAGKIAPQ